MKLLISLIIFSLAACTPEGDGGGSSDAAPRDTSEPLDIPDASDTQPEDTTEPLEDGVMFLPRTRQQNETCVQQYDCVRLLVCRPDTSRCDVVTCGNCPEGTGCVEAEGVCTGYECSESTRCLLDGLGSWCTDDHVCIEPN